MKTKAGYVYLNASRAIMLPFERGNSIMKFMIALGIGVLACGCIESVKLGNGWEHGQKLYKEGRYQEAELEFRRSLHIIAARYGDDSIWTAHRLRMLAATLDAQGRFDESRPIVLKMLQIFEKRLGSDNPELADPYMVYAINLARDAKYDEAEASFRKSLNLRDKSPHMIESKALTLYNLATIYRYQERFKEAKSSYLEAMNVPGQWANRDSIKELTLCGLAIVLQSEKQYKEARSLLDQALSRYEEAGKLDNPHAAECETSIVWSLVDQGHHEEAVSRLSRVVASQRQRVIRNATSSRALAFEKETSSKSTLASAVRIGWLIMSGPGRSQPGLVNETLEVAQVLQATETSAATARIAARFGADDDGLAAAIREHQDLVEQWRALDRADVAATEVGSGAKAAAVRDELRRIAAEVDTSRREIGARFPEYDAIMSPEPASIPEIRALLGPEEALLVYLALERDPVHNRPEASFAWFVRRDRAEMRRLDLAPSELEVAVRQLRAQLDPAQTGTLRPFDAALAHDLYRKLLPFDPDLLAGIRHLLVVPDGPLESLPFSVLVRTPPKPDAGEEGRVEREQLAVEIVGQGGVEGAERAPGLGGVELGAELADGGVEFVGSEVEAVYLGLVAADEPKEHGRGLVRVIGLPKHGVCQQNLARAEGTLSL
jgi:tetratricopeptide (TPR) repeat protein